MSVTQAPTRPDGQSRMPWRTAAWLGTLFAALTSGRSLILLSARGESVAWWRVVVFGLAQWWLWAFVGVLVWRSIQTQQRQFSDWRRLVLTHLPVAALISVARAFMLSLLGKFLLESPSDVRSLREWVTSYLLTQTAFDLLIYAAIMLAALSYQDRLRAAERDRQRERLSAQLVQAELRALRMQLHPHFLFNTLHAISVLIDERPTQAREMIVRLGDLLRSTLAADGSPEVPLSHEVDFVRRYLEIEAVRFADRLQIQFDVPQSLETALVPNFLLQPLVENAIHHGINHLATPGKIVVSARAGGTQLLIDVWNDGALLPDASATGVGLSATRARLDRLHGAAGRVELSASDGGVRARVTLPLVWSDHAG